MGDAKNMGGTLACFLSSNRKVKKQLKNMKVDLTEAISDIFIGDSLRRFCMIFDADTVYMRRAIPTMVTLLMDGISERGSTPEGAAGLLRLLEEFDGKILESTPNYFKDLSPMEQGHKMLPRLLGAKLPKAVMRIAKITQLDAIAAENALAFLAPLLLHHLGRDVQKYHLDNRGLVRYLSVECAEIRATRPGLIGLIQRYLLKYNIGIKRA
jgi:Bacterial protein of unknown function (DUF937)